MVLEPLFDEFTKTSPVSVMVRASLEYALHPEALDALFEHAAQRQYTRVLPLVRKRCYSLKNAVSPRFDSWQPAISQVTDGNP